MLSVPVVLPVPVPPTSLLGRVEQQGVPTNQLLAVLPALALVLVLALALVSSLVLALALALVLALVLVLVLALALALVLAIVTMVYGSWTNSASGSPLLIWQVGDGRFYRWYRRRPLSYFRL
jgi:hypothetical protein